MLRRLMPQWRAVYGVFSVQSQAAEDIPQLRRGRASPCGRCRQGRVSHLVLRRHAAQRGPTAAFPIGTPNATSWPTSANSASVHHPPSRLVRRELSVRPGRHR